ncbi:hypothetical protein ACT3R7_12040 [Halomonas sp. AOP43-A1-21]
MADNHQQPGAVGDSGRSERSTDAQVGRTKLREGYAKETESDAVATVDVSAPQEVKAEPPKEERDAKPLGTSAAKEVSVTLNVAASTVDARIDRSQRTTGATSLSGSSVATQVQTLLSSAAFQSVSPEMGLLDPARNGVLAALQRIERNTALSTPGTARAERVGRPSASPKPEGASALAAPGRANRLGAAGATGNISGLRQQIYRVKRIERQADRSLPPIKLSNVPADSVSASVDALHGRASTTPAERSQGKPSEQLANAGKERRSPPEKPVGSREATADAKPAAKPLSADELRKLPLRGDSGQFLSRDEKAGMSKAELAQAKTREERQQAKREEKTDSLLGKLGEVAHGTLANQGDATDGVGTAVGNAYYTAAKEVYNGFQELAGEDSKGRELYKWATAQWDKKRAKDADGQPKKSDGQPQDTATPSGEKKSSESSDSLASDRQARDAKHQHEEDYSLSVAESEAREEEHRTTTAESEKQHKETTETLEALSDANAQGFEDVVEAVEGIRPGGGGGGLFPFRNPFARGGARGGRGGANRGGRGRIGRTWDRLRGRAPAAGANATGGATARTTGNASATSNTARAATNATTATAATAATTNTATAARGVTAAQQGAANAGGLGSRLLAGAQNVGSRAVSAGASVARGGSRLLGWAAAPVTGYLSYRDTQNELAEREDLTDKQKQAISTGSGVGAGGGAMAGAAAGGAMGAAAGSVVPVVGTAVVGFLGAIVGGALGAWGGEKAGRNVGEAVADTMDNVEEEARKALDEREDRLQRKESRERAWYNPMTWFSGGGQPAQQSPQAPQSFSAMPGAGARASQAASSGSRSASTDTSLIERDDFGRVAEKYESGGRGVSTVSTGIDDAGGVSYGKHQLASNTGTMQAFLDSREGEAYREEFAGMRAGSNEFSAKYREVAERDADGFADAQHAFIARTHYDPVANYAATQGMDTESEAIQEALYSQSVQHSGAGNRKIIDDAMSRIGEGASEDEVIDALYDARGDYASQFASPSATRDRYAREREDVRAISQANAAETRSQEASQLAAVDGEQGESTPAALSGEPTTAPALEADARPMTVEAAVGYAVNGVAAPVEPTLPSEPVSPIDDRQAAKAFHPAPAAPAPGRSPRERREPSASQPALAAQKGASSDGRSDGNPVAPRGGTSGAGLNDIQTGFTDPVLTLMAMDRL